MSIVLRSRNLDLEDTQSTNFISLTEMKAVIITLDFHDFLPDFSKSVFQ